MAVAVTTGIFLVVCALSPTTNTMAASLGRTSIGQAEQRLNELAKLLSNIKNSVRPRHCNDLRHVDQMSSGTYTIFPLDSTDSNDSGQIVHCDMETDGGGWTVIQRRGQFGNPAYYFYRNWTEYASGFGDPEKEYWIGNKALHALTSDTEDTTLRIVLTNGTGESVSLEYRSFRVGSEKELFKLKVGNYVGKKGLDTLREGHNDCSFSTYDRDNDRWRDNCAEKYRGGWWYNACHAVNLNGLNLNGPFASTNEGIVYWPQESPGNFEHWSYPEVVMMIRTNG